MAGRAWQDADDVPTLAFEGEHWACGALCVAGIDEVGRGIAVAFVATVYGVAVSNLVFLPAANKLKARIRQDAQDKELLLEGVCSIVEGMNPKLIRVKLEAFLQHASKPKKKTEKEAAGAGAPAPAKG